MSLERPAITYDFEAAFSASSLSRTILGMDIAEKAVPFTSQTIIPPAISPDLSKTPPKDASGIMESLAGEGILGTDIHDIILFVKNVIDSDKYRDDVSLIEATAQYLSFLQSDTHINGKLFAASLPFQEYFKKSIKSGMPGRYFQRVFEEIADGNSQKIEFVSKACDGIIIADKICGFLRYRSSSNMNKFQEAIDSLLNVAFHNEDDSNLRRFILEYPTEILGIPGYIEHTGYNERNPQYDPDVQVQRLKTLADIINPEDHLRLANYLQSTLPSIMPLETARTLDEEIQSGNVSRANTVVSFFQVLYAKDDENKKTQVTGRNALFRKWVPEFMDGNITEEELLQLASNFHALKSALISLPDPIMGDVAVSGIGLQWTESIYNVELLTTEPAFLRDGSLIAQVISAGINPPRHWADMIKDKGEALDSILEFGQSLFDLSEDFILVYGKIRIIEHFLQGSITEDHLRQISERLHILQKVLQQLRDQGYSKQFVEFLTSITVKDCISSEDAPESIALYNLLLPKRIYPTRAIRAYIRENGIESIDKLEQLKAETARGNLDSQNQIQKELEFFQYADLITGTFPFIPDFEEAYRNFSALQVKEDNQGASLTYKEELEAESAAYEAAKVYWLVKERVDRGRNVIVIGNQRYGDLFVVQPLESMLAELNASERRVAYVRSSGSNNQSTPQIFPTEVMESFVRSLITRSPDIVIVDGTPNSFQGGIPRLPSSMNGFYNWFLAFNEACDHDTTDLISTPKQLKGNVKFQELVDSIKTMHPEQPYKISHWVPNPGDQIIIGSNPASKYISPSSDEPEVILVNPVITPQQSSEFPMRLATHQPGYFDDPENKTRVKKEVVLTKKGVQSLVRGKTTEQLVSLVQNRMTFVMEEMIRATNPLRI